MMAPMSREKSCKPAIHGRFDGAGAHSGHAARSRWGSRRVYTPSRRRCQHARLQCCSVKTKKLVLLEFSAS